MFAIDSNHSVEMQQPIVWKCDAANTEIYPKGEWPTSVTRKTGSARISLFSRTGASVSSALRAGRSVIEGGDCNMIWCDELVPLYGLKP
jgi:hypothetical protein